MQLAGMNPYVHAPDDPAIETLRDADWKKINHPDYPAIYPPLAQMQFLAAAAVLPSVYIVKFLHAIWDVLTIIVIASCLRQRKLKPHLAALYGLCPLVITGFAVEGHLDSLMLLMMAMMIWSVMRGRTRLAGLFLALAVSAKIVAVIFVPWFLFNQRRALPVAVAVLILTYLPYAGAGMALFESLLRFTRESPFFSPLGALSVTSFDTESSRRIVAAVMGITLLFLGWRRKDLTHYGIAATGVARGSKPDRSRVVPRPGAVADPLPIPDQLAGHRRRDGALL